MMLMMCSDVMSISGAKFHGFFDGGFQRFATGSESQSAEHVGNQWILRTLLKHTYELSIIPLI